MPEKACGHPDNPPEDVDKEGKPYESCTQCYLRDYDAFCRVYEKLGEAQKDTQ